MKLLITSAIALTLASMPGLANDNEWLDLDQELESLSAGSFFQNNGPNLGGYLFTSYRNSGDIPGGGGNDLGGFDIDRFRVELTGDRAGYDYKASFDVASGVATIRDAYVNAPLGENISARFGRFKQPFLRSGLLSSSRLFFHDMRTQSGSVFSGRDNGLMLHGDFDMVHWYVAAQNGADSVGDDLLLTGRLEANLVGETGVPGHEGAYGAGDETNVTVGLSIADESFLDNGTHFALEAAATSGPFSIQAEIVDYDEDIPFLDPILATYGAAGQAVGDTTPFSVTATYMFTEDWEAGVRFEDADNDDDTSRIMVGVQHYVDGHNLKWNVTYETIDTDNAVGDLDVFGFGLGLRF